MARKTIIKGDKMEITEEEKIIDYINEFNLDKSGDIPNNEYTAFMLLDSIDRNTFLSVLSDKIGVPAINIKGKTINIMGLIFTNFYSIPQWLNYIHHAKFIVTDSFHCTIFSILFKKKFAVIAHKKRGKSRLESLLSTFGLEDRLFETESDLLNSNLWQDDIDYNKIDVILERERQKSKKFLIDALK